MLDQLSGGRLTLGVGLGSDRFGGELSKTGEQVDDRQRGQMLDESLDILTAAWSGQPVHHHGPHYTVDGIRFLPRPVQRPGVPVSATGLAGNVKPLHRAARCRGFFPVNLGHAGQLAEAVAGLRPPLAAPYYIAVGLPPGTDPAPYAGAGATWWLPEFDPATMSLDQVRGRAPRRTRDSVSPRCRTSRMTFSTMTLNCAATTSICVPPPGSALPTASWTSAAGRGRPRGKRPVLRPLAARWG